MKAYVFPGQGSQFPTMGKDLYEKFEVAKKMFQQANEILGFPITEVMFSGTEEDLKQTKVTQPAIFLHSIICKEILGKDFQPDMVAGHSLGEFSALVAAKVLPFEEGLRLVATRAQAMQRACETTQGTMAAVLGLEDHQVEEICKQVSGIVTPANYNCPGQLVISGEITSIEVACEKLKEAGAKRALLLSVSGAFHSELMQSAREELATAIESVTFGTPICPIYQNVTATGITDPSRIKENLITQLTSSVRWTQSVEQMIKDGAKTFIEVGPGKVLQGLVKKINKDMEVQSPTF